jgi:DNA polymerase-3 subunit epsilon
VGEQRTWRAALIDRLPQAPGTYVLHGEGNSPLLTAAAANLKLHVRNYFRIDRAADRALEHSHRITDIIWHVTRGFLGARLHASVLNGTLPAKGKTSQNPDLVPWQFLRTRCRLYRSLFFSGSRASSATEFFGLFASERKARNALLRLATARRLCHLLLGVSDRARSECAACHRRLKIFWGRLN